jgi:hypothetical protein
MTAPVADRAAGVLQGATDAALGVKHEARAWRHSDAHPDGRTEAAQARWEAGLAARNTFERDAYRVLENDVAAGANRLARQGKRATAMEAAMTAEAKNKEAGS